NWNIGAAAPAPEPPCTSSNIAVASSPISRTYRCCPADFSDHTTRDPSADTAPPIDADAPPRKLPRTGPLVDGSGTGNPLGSTLPRRRLPSRHSYKLSPGTPSSSEASALSTTL